MKKIKSFFYKKGISVLFKTKNVKNSVVFSPGQQDGDTVQNWDRGKKGFFLKKCVLKAKVFKMSQKTCVKSF